MSIVRVGSAEAGSPWMIWRCALFFPLLLTSCLNQLKLWLEALELALIERGNFIFIARDYSDRDRESSTGKQARTYNFTEISDLLSTHTGRHGFACRGFCIIRYDLCTKKIWNPICWWTSSFDCLHIYFVFILIWFHNELNMFLGQICNINFHSVLTDCVIRLKWEQHSRLSAYTYSN